MWTADMDSLQLFLDQFKASGEAESVWLQRTFRFVTRHLCPLLSGPAPPAADDMLTGVSGAGVCSHQLSVCVVKKIQEHMSVTHTLPVSYRPVSMSELLSRQRLACVSNLSWSTNQQRAWAKEAELTLPGHRALPRVNLLLIGCLREGGGEWRLTDASGSVRCECLSPSPLWLNRPVFLPHWNYIPHDAPGQDRDEAGGHVELIGSPVLLCAGPERGLAAGPGGGAELSRAVGVREAAGLLHNRTRGQRVSVCGQVGSVCPLLVVAGTTFFCFSLTDDSHSLPVLVKDSSRLWWTQRVCVGQSVCVTALRVCVLRGWRGNNILCVTDRSEIQTNYTHTQEDTHSDSQSDTPPPPMMSHADGEDCEEAEPERDVIQSAVRMNQSRVISYQGTVTEVVSEGAGLYVIDRKVGLCLAYQPTLRRKLRAGDSVELHHVHFLYRPCPDFPPSMLCTCLRSSLRVTAFSRVGGSSPDSSCPGDGALPRLLLETNMGVSEYLWTCHLSSQLSHSLVPSVLKQQCVCVLSWKLMEFVWRRGRGGRGRRDIYSEMLDEPHTCPLTQYSVDPAVHQYISVSELSQSLQSDCWSSVSLSSLLPPGGSSLTRSQINTELAWSCRTLTSDPQNNPQTGDRLRQRPLLLVGVLELPSPTPEHALQLRDGTGAVACVVTETSEEEEGGQTAAFNTAWIGCLVCVQQFTMVTERFIQSDFPSYQHLDQDKYITRKHCRVYLQFSLDHLHILSPSVAMVTHLRQRGEVSGGDVTGRKQTAAEEEREGGQTAGRKRRRETGSSHSASSVAVTTGPVGGGSRPCVSMVIMVQQKEGVAWRNTGVELQGEEAGLTLCFSIRAAVIGPVVSWGRDPKNEPMTDRETETEKEDKVVLVLSGVSARWFPLLQPGCFYRLIAANTQDPSVFIGCGVSGRSGVELHTDSTLQVQSDWRFHTLTRPLLLHSCRQALSPTVLSVSGVLDCRSELVCFQALVSERISLNDRTSDSGDTHTGVRLTVCDKTGRSLQVYLDLSHTPYPPGLLPGNTLLLSAFQRKVSRTGSVYCSYLPVSSVTVISLGDTSSARPPPAPMMHLGVWAVSREQRCIVGRVKGHVVCFLFLQLQWSCSLCGSQYMQSCSSSQCRSTSSVFQSNAKLVIDDGTGEAHVWFSGALVRPLLGLADCQWEGLQRALRVRGHVRIYPRGRSLVCVFTCLSLSLRCVTLTTLSSTSCCVCAAVMLCVVSCLSPAGNTTSSDQKR
ncbi:CST complex subunit CTC1 isoform X2 [Siniperca chuatsi]|uniref:CST complex subunit CTC1 isoform X2 n=1 Tax=Siniperca chuatsi TaxID=119488 RepID=UPI001CE075E6|nr:CST complex subunit CTC1 isoform X2 [Siniperca chuatsi]